MVLTVISGNTGITMKPQIDPCRVFGVVYFEQRKEMADFSVFITTTEAFADVVVFEEDNQLMADDSGLWYVTKERAFADYVIYLEEDENLADFNIFYTDIQAYATCN